MQDIEQTIITIRNAIRDLPQRYSDNLEHITKLEKEENDILHYIELVNFNAYEGYKASDDLQKVRKQRRIYKDENELLKHIQPVLTNMKSQIRHLDDALGNVRHSKRNMENRSYKVRVRKDLDKAINGVKT